LEEGTISDPMEERTVFDRKELDRHSIASDIADEFSCLMLDVEQMLSQERHQLEQEAHIKVFIPLLAIKQVKELLRLNRHVPLRDEPPDLNHPLPAHDGMGP
jgi:hypothetical protein